MSYRSLFAALFVLVGLALIASPPAGADEIWIAPANQPANHAVGDWATTPGGDTHFSIAVPEHMETKSLATMRRLISSSSSRNNTPCGNRIAQRPVFGSMEARMCCQKA
jgi:hypothetical protein